MNKMDERDALCKTLREMDIKNKKVLKSIRSVPRHCFVPDLLKAQAYENQALPIGYHQTISQPYIVALMCEAADLKSSDRVLEVGTGSGYGAAVLARLAHHIYSIELIPELAAAAQARLNQLSYSNVTVLQGDGSVGLPSEAPFNAIIVTATAPCLSKTLQTQLDLGGRLILPIQQDINEVLLKVTRVDKATYTEEMLGEVRFVPLRGQEGWIEDHSYKRDSK
jgi:protein-L-isoaspartate(D-aspartate) O-methyltransferase